jgi:surface carbohydrate biosynthesis protein
MKKRIYLPIEVQNRELDARLDLAAKLLEKDWEIVIGRFNDVVNLAQQLGGGVLFYKGHSDFVIQKKLMPAIEAGTRIVCLDEEGLIFPSADWYIRHRIGTGSLLEKLDAIFTWGPLQHDILSNRFPDLAQKLHMTGNQRLRPSLRVNDKVRNVILINTNFGPANLSKTISDSYVQMVEKQRTETSLEERQFLESRQDYYSHLVQHYLSFARRLALENKRRGSLFRIVLRPHPIEDMLFWSRELSDVDVEIETLKPTTDFLPFCHCVIHTGCTTAIEAFIAGVNVLRYNPIYPNDNIHESIIPNAISEGITEPHQVFSAVNKNIDLHEALSDFIFFGDRSPNEIQVEIIEGLEINEGHQIFPMSYKDAFWDGIEMLKCKLLLVKATRKIMKRLIGAKDHEKMLSKFHRWPLLSIKDVKRGCSQSYSVKKVCKQVFLLRN